MYKILLYLLVVNISIFGQSQIATIIKSPNPLLTNDSRTRIFLGGSIDMGKSINW